MRAARHRPRKAKPAIRRILIISTSIPETRWRRRLSESNKEIIKHANAFAPKRRARIQTQWSLKRRNQNRYREAGAWSLKSRRHESYAYDVRRINRAPARINSSIWHIIACASFGDEKACESGVVTLKCRRRGVRIYQIILKQIAVIKLIGLPPRHGDTHFSPSWPVNART